MAIGRRGAALLAATVTGLLLALGGTATATAAPAPAAPGKCDIGTANGAGAAKLDGKPATFVFDVCETGPAATNTTGRFTPKGAPLAAGPVQCADLNEHTMAFLYAVDAGVDKGKQVLVVVSDGGPKPGDDRIALSEPRSAQDFKNGCGLGTGPAQQLTQKWQPLTSGNLMVALHKKK